MLFTPPIARMVALLAGLHGTVRSAGGGQPAFGVHVELDGVDRTLTDSAGRYSLNGLSIGTHQLQFVSDGFEIRQLTVFLVDSSNLALDVELTARLVSLPPIDVVAPGSHDPGAAELAIGAEWHEAGHYRLAPGWQAGQPAGAVDIQDALAHVPGVTTRGDNTTALSIHGARGSESLMLLDGIPVFGAVHFAGASSAVNPDAVAAIDVHTGVSSARFGGALSGVVELETSEALNGSQLAGDLSTADVRLTARAPLGANGGVLLGARSSFRNLLTDAAGPDAPNGYQDFIAVGRGAIGRGLLRIVGFESTNRLRWEPAIGGPDRTISPTTVPAALAPSDAANWQSGTFGATWTQANGPDGAWHAAGWWSGNTAAITTLASDRTVRLTSGIGDLGLSTEWQRRFRASTLLFGGQLTRTDTWYTTSTSFTQSGVGAAGITLTAAPVLGAVYGEWNWHSLSRIDFRAGLRGSTNFQRSMSLDPRILVNLHSDRATRIGLGFGRTHQVAQSMLNEDNLMSAVIGPALLASSSNSLRWASADQWVLSIGRGLAPGVTVTLEAYTRSWHDVLAPAVTGTGFFITNAPVYGDGDASGASASVSIVRPRLTVQASAGVASSVQRAGGMSYPSSFDQPWSFSGDIKYRVPGRTTFQVRWNAGAGQPATATLSGIEWHSYQPATGIGEIEGAPINLVGAINALRLPGSLRLDLGVRREWAFGAGRRLSGIITAVRLENVFNRADPIGGVVQPDGSLQWLRGIPRGVVFEVGWSH